MAKRSSEISNLNKNLLEDLIIPKKLKEECDYTNIPSGLTLNNDTQNECDLELKENHQQNGELLETNGSSSASLIENPLSSKQDSSNPKLLSSSNADNSEPITSQTKDEREKQNNELDKITISDNREEEPKPPEDIINTNSTIDCDTTSPQTPSTSNNDEKQKKTQELDENKINKTQEESQPKKDANLIAVQTTDLTNSPQQPSSTTTRETCFYFRRCFRKNPEHKREYAHPGDDDYVSDKDDPRPQCKYGKSCYRTSTQHRKDFKHSRQRNRQATTRNTYMGGSSEDEFDDLDDFFIIDDSDEYEPSDQDIEEEEDSTDQEI